jgi:conjugal transfer pilus assembly protein TraU
MKVTINFLKSLVITLSCLMPTFGWADTDPTCHGKFANPITDYCWSCVFPISMGGHPVMADGQEDNESSQIANPICICNNPPQVGMNTGFWEPSRLVDVTRTPYCFVGLGGIKMDFGISAPRHAQADKGGSRPTHAFYQAHWYTNTLMYWLEVLMDDYCLERSAFDVAYMTEFDPLWDDSETSFIINPDVALWSNPVAQAACAIDCIAASAGFPLDTLFWCSGCQGSMYPLNGWISAKVGAVQASSLIVARMATKMHRQMLMWAASGSGGQCGYYPQVVMQKSNYKYYMLYPVPQTEKIEGKCCQPFGRTTVIWGAGKEIPVIGEDFSYEVLRKRDCCEGNLINYITP